MCQSLNKLWGASHRTAVLARRSYRHTVPSSQANSKTRPSLDRAVCRTGTCPPPGRRITQVALLLGRVRSHKNTLLQKSRPELPHASRRHSGSVLNRSHHMLPSVNSYSCRTCAYPRRAASGSSDGRHSRSLAAGDLLRMQSPTHRTQSTKLKWSLYDEKSGW